MRCRNEGQSLTEFLIVVPVVLMLIFGAIQLGLIYGAKNNLRYAAFEAARVGALTHARFEGMRKGIIRGMGPMFTRGSTDNNGQISTRVRDATDGYELATVEADQYLRIMRLNPRLSDFDAYGEVVGGKIELPNDNLMFRSAIAQGGGRNLQDANLLKVRLEYCYELIVPFIHTLMAWYSKEAASAADQIPTMAEQSRADYSGVYDQLCGERNGFIISAEAIVRLQSPAQRADADCRAKMYCEP